MSGRYDVTIKHLLATRLADWSPLLGVAAAVRVQPVDTDLSYVSTIADKVLIVEETPPWVLHIEPHAWDDDGLDLRMLHYHTALLKRLGLPVHSAVVVLHPSAWTPANRGWAEFRSPRPGCGVRFDYEVIRIWEMPVETFLEGGVGLLPLAPLANVSRDGIPAVVSRIRQRVTREIPQSEAAELCTATFLLMGLKYSQEETYHFLRALRPIMQSSATYQALIDEGYHKGVREGREEGREEGTESGKRETLLLMGSARFGKPGVRVRRRLEAIRDAAVLDALALRLLEVDSWKDLLSEVPTA